MKAARSIVVSLLLSATALGQSPLSTAFTYQGQLKNAGVPVNNTAEFQFSLWDAATGGTQVGSTVPVSAVNVAGGLSTTTLDFGAGAFDGNALAADRRRAALTTERAGGREGRRRPTGRRSPARASCN